MSNRVCVERAFAPALIRSQLLNTPQCALVVMFMVEHAREVGLCPTDTEDKIRARLLEEVGGQSEAASATRKLL